MPYDWTSYCSATVNVPTRLSAGVIANLPRACGETKELYTLELIYTDGSTITYAYCDEHRRAQVNKAAADPAVASYLMQAKNRSA